MLFLNKAFDGAFLTLRSCTFWSYETASETSNLKLFFFGNLCFGTALERNFVLRIQ